MQRGRLQHVGPLTAYLGTAEAVLPSDDAWVQGVAEQKGELLAKITSPKHRAASSTMVAIELGCVSA